MTNPIPIIQIIVIVLAVLGCGLAVYCGYLQKKYSTIKHSFDDIDEQAKLIVKTDLELSRTQEELDKRLIALDALQRISRLISTTLDEREILASLTPSLLNQLGFERYLFFLFTDKGSPYCAARFGCGDDEAARLLSALSAQEAIINQLKNRQTVSSLNIKASEQNLLAASLGTRQFIITPIISQNKFLGILLVSNDVSSHAVTEGDEEIISILADQIGQALDNARLFDETFHSRQQLELNVQERTRQLEEALAHVRDLDQKKSEFISAVSHELRTPLTSIKGFASILISGKLGELPEAVRDRLEKINKHSDSLVQLINNLLDISRIEAGKTEMKFKPSSLIPLVTNVQDLLLPQLKDKQIECVASIPHDLPTVDIDTDQIERVLINLVGNAIKFTPVQGTITITAEAAPEQVRVSVKDTGIGLKPEDCQKLFDEFYRVDNTINQNVKGTGLGLSLAKKIVLAHHGNIWVESAYGHGATFFFALPRVQPGRSS